MTNTKHGEAAGTTRGLGRSTVRRLLVVAAAALALASTAAASDWTTVQRISDSGRWGTHAYVYGDGLAARLTLRASRGKLVRISGSVSCWSADYSRRVSRDLTPSRFLGRGVRGVTYVRFAAASMPDAAGCSFSFMAFGDEARELRATLAIQPA